jgi:hypothetical protein
VHAAACVTGINDPNVTDLATGALPDFTLTKSRAAQRDEGGGESKDDGELHIDCVKKGLLPSSEILRRLESWLFQLRCS